MAKNQTPRRSFDLFDTLIGRFHCFSHSVFEQVEQTFPFPGFSLYRIAAEEKSDHTLPNIYQHLQEMLDLTDSQTQALMEFEFQTELNQIYPIQENVNLVQEGDLLVSDTYYSQSQIEKILTFIGLKKKVQIHASPLGKHSGKMWDHLKGKYAISSHLGDSLHSDVHMASSRGISAIHYTGSGFTAVERALLEIGQVSLSCLIRALRLQNPYTPFSPEYAIWNEQCQLNVPLLIQSSLYLDAFCKKRKKKKVLFTMRDGCLWMPLFQKLFPQYEPVPFHTCRSLYVFPTPTFIEYAKSVYTDDAVIVDSNGRGITCETFFQKHLNIRPTYLSIVNCSKKRNAILRTKHPHDGIEKMNYDTVGALYDVLDGKAHRASPEYNLQYIYPSHACLAKCLEIISHYRFDRFDKRIVDWAATQMELGLALDKHIQHARYHIHIPLENSRIRHLHQVENGLFIETS